MSVSVKESCLSEGGLASVFISEEGVTCQSDGGVASVFVSLKEVWALCCKGMEAWLLCLS